ncbi:MAG: glycosyltransferase family 4 protein, partial [Peptococcaceae bacterium]|nr:glycosyltransferase family 4 protein [Peptococcaceae bacterium]
GHLLQAMVGLGHEVVASAPDRLQYVSDALKEIEVTYEQVFFQRTGTDPLADVKAVFDFWRFFSEVRPDIVLLYTIKPVIYGSLAAKFAGVPDIFSMITGAGYVFGDCSPKQRYIRIAIEPLYRQALEYNKKVFFQNPDDRDLFLRRRLISDPEQCVLINGSGVDIDYFEKTPVSRDKISFLLVARLIGEKGIYEYAEAARRLKQLYPEVTFRLLGPFDSNPTSIHPAKIEQWQSEGIIEYLGETRDVRPYMAQCSVFVLPSYREGTPRTVLEAMAIGRAIVTTDAPGCRETVVEGINGYLVPVRDVDSLARALERFIKDPELIQQMGKESRRIAVEKYDVRKVNRVILETMDLC